MASINKVEVQLNDSLYDIVNGHGKVVALTVNTVDVLFDNGRRLQFDKYGQLNGVRRLFWHAPIVLDPPKDESEWRKIVDTIATVYNLLKRIND